MPIFGEKTATSQNLSGKSRLGPSPKVSLCIKSLLQDIFV